MNELAGGATTALVGTRHEPAASSAPALSRRETTVRESRQHACREKTV